MSSISCSFLTSLKSTHFSHDLLTLKVNILSKRHIQTTARLGYLPKTPENGSGGFKHLVN